MKRLHMHVAVDDLNQSIQFYSTLFAADPTVLKGDYAKWMLDDPRMNFAISQRGAAVGLNHIGIQVEHAEELADMHTRLTTLNATVLEESEAACCYAQSDKYWVTDPSGLAWETFHTLDTIPVFGKEVSETKDACCAPLVVASAAEKTSPSCCVPKAGGGCC